MDDPGEHPKTDIDLSGEGIWSSRTKWGFPILLQVRARALRFSQIEKRIGSVSRKSLSETLRLLEREGLVERTVHPTAPPKVEYSITPLGKAAARAYEPVARFASDHHDELAAARRRFDRKHRS